MNDVFLSFLRPFVLVFFDDILIYSLTWAEHLRHVRIVFQTLHDHHLHLKRSKCEFGLSAVSYLPRDFERGCRHGPTQDPGHPQLAFTVNSTRGTWHPRLGGLQSPIHPQLRHHCGIPDSPTPQRVFPL